MNIEEAIDVLKNSIADYVIGEYCEKCADNKICDDRAEDCYFQQAIDIVVTAYEKEKEKNKNAYRKANNYLYFNDSADYEVALWEVIRTLRPDLADKWDNGEDAVLEYIEEE